MIILTVEISIHRILPLSAKFVAVGARVEHNLINQETHDLDYVCFVWNSTKNCEQ